MRTLLGHGYAGDLARQADEFPCLPLFREVHRHGTTDESGELSSEVRIMSAVAQATAVMDASLETDVVLARVVEYACLLFDVASAAVLLPSSPDAYVVGASHGLRRMAKDTGLTDEVVRMLGFNVPVPLFIPNLSCLSGIVYFEDLVSRGLVGALALPLVTDTGLEGIFLLHDRHPFHLKRIDLEALRIFGTHAAAALRNAERYQMERSAGDVLRKTILALPDAVPAARFAYSYQAATRSAAVGGDFYDIFQTDDKMIGVVIGDVSGKGLEAAATTVLARNSVKAYAQLDPNPASVLERLNSLLCHSTGQDTFVTLAYFLLDSGTGRMDYGVAGHPPALLKRSAGAVEALERPAAPLGIFSQQKYDQGSTGLAPADILFVYTDGLIEARRGRYLFGERRLTRLVRKAPQDPERLIETISRALRVYSRRDYRDDVALFAMSYEPESDAARPG